MEFAEAIKDYTKTLELDPGNSLAYLNRGLAKAELGDKNNACLDFKKALELGNKKAEELISKHCK